ncbi:hypothetical protein A0J61_04663 [Choanephora cucurbitarum]|uniref:Uncharacterized protein n=1 Tax=Choanephora cucurbitarum TaxID=101091 RepID=A0A1C7NIY6_9FUNG|nr:hypothetical protein A0J61_04663 [Choanephora cucurbitarum]
MLLYHVSDAPSSGDLRTVRGVCYPTFQAAARALGLLASDNQWKECLEEAAHMQSPVSLRIIFVSFDPADPYQLWLDFKSKLSKDHWYQLHENPAFDPTVDDIHETACNYALIDIKDILQSHYGTSLQWYDQLQLPSVDCRIDPIGLSLE